MRSTLGYAVACIFSRTLIKEHNGFPVLFNFGVRGTGKSSSMDWFMALFGYQTGNRQSISNLNTDKGLARSMTLARGFPFFLDDYRNHESNGKVNDLTSSILNWYHWMGSSMAKKSTDNQTVETPMKACIVMTGNNKPSDPAVLSRMIFLNYNIFLKKDELSSISKITSNLDRFSEFTELVLQDYINIKVRYFEYLNKNRDFLIQQDIEGRTVNNWSIILAGICCVSDLLPGLRYWENEFEGFRGKICEKIKNEAQLEKDHNPVHEFFQVIEYYATQKLDTDSVYSNKTQVLDHRHFRIREIQFNEYDSDSKVYNGPILAIGMQRIWQTLTDHKTEITRKMVIKDLEHHLENSSFFLSKGKQMMLTKSLEAHDVSNVRCYIFNVTELEKSELLLDVISKAREYERTRLERLKKV